MSKNNSNQQLHNLLVTKNFDPQTLDAQGKPATSAQDADIFSFDYKAASGHDYGTVVIMIGNDNDMNVFFGDNVGKSMEQEDKKSWFDFLFQLRQFAKRNLLTFSLQNLNKLKYSMQGQAAIKEGLFEAWVGTKDTSWNAGPTEARLMIKHKKVIGENDARFRYIESLFVETTEGERYKLPFTKLSGGRAMVEHVRQGGKPYDIRGQHIATIVNEMNLLSRFKRANQGKIFEGDTAQLVTEAGVYYETLQNNLKSLSTQNGYKKYFESWDPAALTDEDVIIEDLRHMFVEQNIDSRIEQALPLLARLQKQETNMKEANIFESWMNLLAEGTWALPDTKEKQTELVTLLSQELPVGADALNATEQLYDLIGDDVLFDRLHELADQNANADARTVIIDRLEELKNNPDVAQVIGQLKIEQQPIEAQTASDDSDAQSPVIDESGINPKGTKMKTFYYIKTIDYSLEVQAETEEEADAIAHATDLDDPNVVATSSDWEENGYAEFDEGILDTAKKVGSKVLNKLGHGSDEDLIKDLQRKAGIPQTGNEPESKKKFSEASWINGRLQDPKELVWKMTSLSYEKAVEKYGKDQVRVGRKNRLGEPTVEVLVPLGGTNMIEERTEVKDPATGKVVSWKDETDWQPIEKNKHGNVKDPKGRIAHLSDKARRETEKLKESTNEVDQLLQDIAHDRVDIMNVFVNPKSNIEKFVANQIREKVKNIAQKRNMDVKRDLDKILPIIKLELEKDYAVDEGAVGRALGTVAGEIIAPEIPGSGMIGGAIGSMIGDKLDGDDNTNETVGGGNWLEGKGIPSMSERCNMTSAGHHCPKHGVEECWQASMTEERADGTLSRIKELAGLMAK